MSFLLWWFHQPHDLKISVWCDCLKIISLLFPKLFLLNIQHYQWPTNISTCILNKTIKVHVSKTESWLFLPHPNTCNSQDPSHCRCNNSILLVVQAKCGLILYLTSFLCHSIYKKNSIRSTIQYLEPSTFHTFAGTIPVQETIR